MSEPICLTEVFTQLMTFLMPLACLHCNKAHPKVCSSCCSALDDANQPGPSARQGRHILEAGPLEWMSDAIDIRLNGLYALNADNSDSDPVVL